MGVAAFNRREFGALFAAALPFPKDKYHGWPTLARRRNGDLLLVWSGDRQAHVCPYGRVLLSVSHDEGDTWTYPRVLLDTDIDDRDAGVVETSRGSLLVTTFTSLAFENVKDQPPEWSAIRDRLSAPARKELLGCWMLRSTDGGVSWSPPYRVPLNSPHGPVVLSGGRLLYAGKDLWGNGDVGVSFSRDDGVTWSPAARLPLRSGDQMSNYHELHAVEAAPGRLIVQIRNHNENGRGETLQCESDDAGRTWTTPHSIGVWGLPSHLLKLRDGRLLMSYGYRRKPFGNLARTSSDAGRTWSEPVVISDDGASGDLGYPSTVETSKGLLTVWYEKRSDSPNATLRMHRWKA